MFQPAPCSVFSYACVKLQGEHLSQH